MKMEQELLLGGMHPTEAKERANNIAQAALMCDIDRYDVAQMIAPIHGFRVGIADPLERSRAATQCLAQFIAGNSTTRISTSTGLQMWLGMEENEADKWIK
jgi:hypothetical protein